MICSCCGKDREDRLVVTLDRSKSVAVCRPCIEQLLLRVGVSSTPTLPVLHMRKAIEFYQSAGFRVRLYDNGKPEEPDFAFANLDGQNVFDIELVPHMDPATNGAGCYIVAKGVDEWHARLSTAGLPVSPVRDEPWGMREFTLTDLSGNRVRIGRAVD